MCLSASFAFLSSTLYHNCDNLFVHLTSSLIFVYMLYFTLGLSSLTGNYEDEQYVKKFGLEMYMFLALTARHKSLKDFERDMAKSYESGNELLPFLQFERLITASQVVPYKVLILVALCVIRKGTPFSFFPYRSAPPLSLSVLYRHRLCRLSFTKSGRVQLRRLLHPPPKSLRVAEVVTHRPSPLERALRSRQAAKQQQQPRLHLCCQQWGLRQEKQQRTPTAIYCQTHTLLNLT